MSGVKVAQLAGQPLMIPHRSISSISSVSPPLREGNNPSLLLGAALPESHSSSANLPSQRGTSASHTGLSSRNKGLLRTAGSVLLPRVHITRQIFDRTKASEEVAAHVFQIQLRPYFLADELPYVGSVRLYIGCWSLFFGCHVSHRFYRTSTGEYYVT